MSPHKNTNMCWQGGTWVVAAMLAVFSAASRSTGADHERLFAFITARLGGRDRRSDGGTRFLGSAPAAGAAGSFAHQLIRFLTETDYPPFNYAGPDGAPTGFNVDLARMICEELKVACTVQMRRFDTLIGALNSNNGDAIIASIAATPEMRARVDFSDPYYRTPARFVARRDSHDRGYPSGSARGQEDRGGRRHCARGISQDAVHRGGTASLSGCRRCALRTEARRGRSPFRRRRLARLLAQRHRLRQLLRVPGRTLSGEPVFRRRRRHRGTGAATTCCGRRSTGRCSGCGKRAVSPICGCVIFRSVRFEPHI